MSNCSAIDLAEIRWSSKISSRIWSIISGMVTILCRSGPDATQMEKSQHLNLVTQFLNVAYDGVFTRNISVRIAWIPFGDFLAWKKMMTVCVSMLLKSRASLTCFLSACVTRKDLQFETWQIYLIDDTIDSVLRYLEVCRAKDLSSPSRK